jgi:hypothetical protein
VTAGGGDDDRGGIPIDAEAGVASRPAVGGTGDPGAFDASIAASIAGAEAALERLDSELATLDPSRIVCRHFRRKEAVCAIRARHPRLSLSEGVLLSFDQREAPPGDPVGEAAAYAAALERGLREPSRPPLAPATLAELRTLIVSNDPVPDPSDDPFAATLSPHAVALVESLDRWHRDQCRHQSIVLLAALASARLAAIRPFASGSGRLVRVVSNLLIAPAFTRSPWALYPSLHFSPAWDDLLGDVARGGDESAWVRFFADAIAASAAGALVSARRLDDLTRADAASIARFGYAGRSAARIHRALQLHPVATIDRLMETSGLHVQAARRAIYRLRALGVVGELTHGSRHRIFTYRDYATILGEGTEPSR